jgi:hypothetical protein
MDSKYTIEMNTTIGGMACVIMAVFLSFRATLILQNNGTSEMNEDQPPSASNL